MTMIGTFNFEPVRPYNDSEVPAAMKAIIEDPFFPMVVKYCLPDANIDEVNRALSQIKTVDEFQTRVMYPAIQAVISKSTDGISFDGFDKIDDVKRHIFIANHRDIALDSAILDLLLYEHKIKTCQITFGSNLMKGNLVINIGKLNKMFRIIRGGNIKDFYRNSLEVSAYMRHVVTELDESVWIAQRNGRTKDGNDKTEMGVLKMFSLSSDKGFVDNLDELSITPVAVSYEYEPCDFLKTAELYISRLQKYVKGENEDLNSILTGIMQDKGRVHFQICDPIKREELEALSDVPNVQFHREVAQILDKRICSNYRLYPNAFIAHDLRYGSSKYAEHYTKEQYDAFTARMAELDKYSSDPALGDIFLGIYANPIDNQ